MNSLPLNFIFVYFYVAPSSDKILYISMNQIDFSSFCQLQIAFKVECLSKGLCLKPWAEVVSVTIAQLITLTVAKWQVSRPLPLQVLWWWGSVVLRCRYLFYPNHLKLCHLNAPRHLNGHPGPVWLCATFWTKTGGNILQRKNCRHESIFIVKSTYLEINRENIVWNKR